MMARWVRRPGPKGRLRQSGDRCWPMILCPAMSVSLTHRWAAHGAPIGRRTAHPHATGEVAIVHNGIIQEKFQGNCAPELAARGPGVR